VDQEELLTVTSLSVATTAHGRVLVRASPGAASGLLVGFHGYAETAARHLERLSAIPGAGAWTLVAIQGLNRFYRGRSRDTIAGWMTREDRETAIADNIGYVDAVLGTVCSRYAIVATLATGDRSLRGSVPLVCVGFSQGVAMAFRAAVRGRYRADAIVAVGADVPPELLADGLVRFPPVLLARGSRDEYYTQAIMDADVDALSRRGTVVRSLVFEAGHEWHASVTAAAGEVLATLRAG
jgi:dienelactone hydrolase